MIVDDLFTISPWPHQRDGVERVIAAFNRGAKSVCLTSPTGSGKTNMMMAITNWAVDQGLQVDVLSNRILLTQQTHRVYETAGVSTGVVSASMPHLEFDDRQVQIATTQTILSRQRNDAGYERTADFCICDELHQQASGSSAELLQRYPRLLGVTATPLGVSNVCDELIVAGRTRDLQDAGILCYASWFAPSELDTRALTSKRVDLTLTETEQRKTWGKTDRAKSKIVGNILGHYKRLHPEQTHTLFYAPGVPQSVWFARFCWTHGIRCLHVDGKDFWCDGELGDRHTDESRFQDCMARWRDGSIPIISNRFVFREGIDEQIKCIVLGTPVGSYRSFLQMVGRGLRVHPDKDACLVIDHGGNWWRWGSVNVNVDWDSVFECSDPDVLGKNRIAKIRETGEPVGVGCPNCGMIHKSKSRFVVCQYCGHRIEMGKMSRPILQADGTLRRVNGEPIKRWRIKETPEAARRWRGLYFNAMKKHAGAVTFDALYNQFHYATAVAAGTRSRPNFRGAYHPPRDLPLMPLRPNDWHRYVGSVPGNRLRHNNTV